MERFSATRRMQHIYKWMAAAAALLLAAGLLSGCSSSNGAGGGAGAAAPTVRVGTMPTEDILPLWVAEAEDLFAESGVDAEVVVFDSAQTLSAAITAGEVDMAMTDIMRAVKLCESGTPVEMEWITLGATPEQGRFGVATFVDLPVDTFEDLIAYLQRSHFPVAVAANTVPEYVFDKLCEQHGIDPASVEHIESPSLPDRYALTTFGQYHAAALPNSFLALGDAQGLLKTLADDTQGDNISQSVMVARAAWAKDNASAIEAVAGAWDAAVALINADGEAYRDVLVENANINSVVADTYPVSDYPTAFAADGSTLVHVPANLVESVVAWMQQKGYTEVAVAYDEETGAFTLS